MSNILSFASISVGLIDVNLKNNQIIVNNQKTDMLFIDPLFALHSDFIYIFHTYAQHLNSFLEKIL